MNRNTSVCLDAVRLLAALTVVAGHVEWTFAPGFMPFIRTYHLATLAVGVFFVLSGFVIGHAVDRNEPNARSYFLDRAARVYSVVIPVLGLTLLLDACGRWIAPSVYGETLSLWAVFKETARLVISLSFVNQFWQLNIPAGHNIPFWSLSYEVTYYVTFGLWYFGGLRWRICALALMAASGPFIVALFSLWLLGFGCYRFCRKGALTRKQGRTLLLLSLMCFGIAPYFAQFFSEDTPFSGGAIGFGQFFLVGIPFACAIVGLSSADISLAGPSWERLIGRAAGATFTIYLLHFPLGTLIYALIPHYLPLADRWFGVFGFLILVCFLVARYTERQKKVWRRLFDEVLLGEPIARNIQK